MTAIAEAFVTLRPQLDKFGAETQAALNRELVPATKAAEGGFANLKRTVAGVAGGFIAAQASIQGVQSVIRNTIGASISFEQSFAGVRKTVDGTDEEIQALASGFRQMAKEIPVNVNEINRIGEAAGQLGIETQNIVGFTRVMADLGVATNMSSDQAATALARLANITQMPQTEFDRLGSTVVELGNNLATTEGEIVDMGLRIAGAGAQVGLTEAQILGLAGAMSSLGIRAEAGGTAISRVMIDIASEVANSGDNLENFARVAGMSAEQFAAAWREDAASALVAFVTGLGNMEAQGSSTLQILEEMGISEIRVRDALLRMSGAGDLLTESMRMGSEAWAENIALTQEAEMFYGTTANQLEVTKNRMRDYGITIGDAVVPALLASVNTGADFVDTIADMVSALSPLTPVLGVMVDALPAIAIGIGAVVTGMAAAQLVTGISAFVSGFQAADLALRHFGTTALRFYTGRTMLQIGEALKSPTAAFLGLAAAITAVDYAIRQREGAGVGDIFFGDFQRARAYNDVVAEQAEHLAKLHPEIDVVADRQAYLNRVNDNFIKKMNEGTSATDKARNALSFIPGVQSTTAIAFGESAAEVQAATEAMMDNDATALQLHKSYRGLSPELREVMIETLGLTSGWELSRAAGEELAAQQDEVAGKYGNVRAELAALTPSFSEVQQHMVNTMGPQQDYLFGIEQIAAASQNVFGEILPTVVEMWEAETGESFEGVRAQIPPTITTVDELRAFLAERLGPEGIAAFESLEEEVRKSFDGIKSKIQEFLPTVNETFAEWKARIQELADAHANFETNLTTIWGHLTSAGVEMPGEILAAVHGMGPEYAAMFAKWFAENPEEALNNLKLIGPIITQDMGDDMLAKIMGFESGSEMAMKLGFVDPMSRTLENAKGPLAALAEAIGVETGAAVPVGLATMADKFNSAMSQFAGDGVEAGRKKAETDAPGIGTEVVDKAAGSVTANAGKLSAATRGAALDAIAAGKEGAAGASSIGTAIIDGIISGIGLRQSLLSATIGSVVSDIPWAMKLMLGIASPSKVIRDEVGVPIAEGLAVGIEQGSGIVETAAINTLNNVNVALSTGIVDMTGATNDRLTTMFNDIATVVRMSSLSDEFKEAALLSINGWIEGLAEGERPTNIAVLTMVDSIRKELIGAEQVVWNAGKDVGTSVSDGVAAGLDGAASQVHPALDRYFAGLIDQFSAGSIGIQDVMRDLAHAYGVSADNMIDVSERLYWETGRSFTQLVEGVIDGSVSLGDAIGAIEVQFGQLGTSATSGINTARIAAVSEMEAWIVELIELYRDGAITLDDITGNLIKETGFSFEQLQPMVHQFVGYFMDGAISIDDAAYRMAGAVESISYSVLTHLPPAINVLGQLQAGLFGIRDFVGLEDPTIADAFRHGMDLSELYRDWEEQFGEIGADLMMALTQGFASFDPRDANSIIRAVEDLIDEAIAVGVPGARELGKGLIDAIHEALGSGAPALIQTAIDLVADLIEAMDEAVEEEIEVPARSLVGGFLDGYAKSRDDRRMIETFGSDGARLIEALNKAIEENTPESWERIGSLVDGILERLTDGLDPTDAASITAIFFGAIRDIIEQEGGAALDALKAILEDINKAGDVETYLNPPIDPRTGKEPVFSFSGLPGEGSKRFTVGLSGLPDFAKEYGISDAIISQAVGKHGLTLDDIPGFSMGLPRVPFDDFPALLHKDEAVLTAPEAEAWRKPQSPTVIIQGPGLSELAHRIRVNEREVFA